MPEHTILIADDEPTIRTYLRAILRVEGFQLVEAGDGIEALQKIEQRGEGVDLLVTDVRMPRMDGVALAHAVSEAYPGTPVLYISGYPFSMEEHRLTHANMCAFLPKPFTRQQLLEAVRNCLGPRNKASAPAGRA
jgi:DNA-binding NtrC family response regulator